MAIKIRISKEKFEVDGEDISRRIANYQFMGTGQGTILNIAFYCYNADGKTILHDAAGPVCYIYKYLNPDIEIVHDGLILERATQN